MDKENILVMVKDCVRDVADISQIKIPEIDEKTPLYGPRGYLDSLGLVSLIAGIEDRLNQKGIPVTIASEKAFSRKISPFLTVRTLVNFIEELIDGK